jgi:stage V sporulation protein K
LRLGSDTDVSLELFFSQCSQQPDFGNARTARTLLERTREAQAVRIAPELSTVADLTELTSADVRAAISMML